MMDTIFALATARGRSGVAVVRISGPRAVAVAGQMMGAVPENRGVRHILDESGEVLDEALVLTFPPGHSFTGESVVELHLHGAPAIISAVLRRLSELSGTRPAEAGEFTRRALDNGRLDLAQVEGLADLIESETEAQRRQAMRVFSGGLGELADDWRDDLIRATALVEATIDFVDEDVPVDVYPEVIPLIDRVKAAMESECAGVAAAELIRDGFEVAIVGAPNVGKSTLLNRLAGREAAITSDIAGTTRDVIEVRLDLAGYAVSFLDTAGIRETDDVVEGIGVDRAIARARDADLRIFLYTDQLVDPISPSSDDIVLRSKVDGSLGLDDGVSGHTGAGIDALIARIGQILDRRVQPAGSAIRDRHRQAMETSIAGMDAAKDLIASDGPTDLIAEELRSAIRAVDMIVGRVDVEDLLDEIFSSFCIGK